MSPPLDSAQLLTQIAALSGLVFGSAGLGLAVANFLRDRHSLRVTLQFDMESSEDGVAVPGHGGGLMNLSFQPRITCVSIANTGRRPVFVSHVALTKPRWRGKRPNLIIAEAIKGRRLSEGDPPWNLFVGQDAAFYNFDPGAGSLRAEVLDTTNKVYYSRAERRPVQPEDPRPSKPKSPEVA